MELKYIRWKVAVKKGNRQAILSQGRQFLRDNPGSRYKPVISYALQRMQINQPAQSAKASLTGGIQAATSDTASDTTTTSTMGGGQ